MATVPIVGSDGKTHHVEAELADQFFSGKTGEPITDAEWDEQKARLEQDNTILVPEWAR